MPTTRERLSSALSERYRIERELGQGGMATVYLAEDLKHRRKVALKVLKPELAAVLGAERFVQEITTTAALQHPHILPLFDSGTADGFLYYVMPFIQGETLRAKLDRETQLGVEEAVKLACDVADALHYAHSQGVIHRDIKPENILLANGRPMVADFGIALAVSAAAGGRMTETGLSLGTPHYMSPEQATAEKDISARSDVYSLASVLYEMLAGEPPHTGGSAQQIIMKIITEEPAVVTTRRKSVPPHVAAAVARALEKLPADRFESARHFADALASPGFTHGGASPQSVTARRRWIPLTAGLATAAALLTAAVWGWQRDPGTSPSANLRLLIDFPEGRAPIFQPGGAFSLSPDGSRLAYMGGGRRAGGSDTWRLWIRPLDRLTADSIPGSEGAHTPTWSPGGDSVAFVVGGELRVFSTRPGGGVATIRRADEILYGMSWSRERGILFATTSGLHRIEPSSGKEEALLPRARGAPRMNWPFWVDGGRSAIVTGEDLGDMNVTRRRDAPPGKPRVLLARLDGSARVDTLADGFNGQPLPNGDILWAEANGTVYTAGLDLDRGRLSGGRTQLFAGVHVEPGLELRLSVSRQGTVVYASSGAVQAGSRLVVVDRRTGERRALPGPPNVRLFPDLRLAPDGMRLAAAATRGVSHLVWLYTLGTGQVEAFTEEGISYHVAWTPAGDVTYCSNLPSDAAYVRPADKRSAAQRLAPNACPRNWTPDGKTLLLDDGGGVWTVAPPDTVARPIPGGSNDEFAPAVSPDGRWLAYATAKSGTTEVWVRGFRASGGPWQVSQGGGFDPVWSRDGRSLYFRTDTAIVVAAVTPGDVFRASAPIRVTSASSSVAAIYGQSFDVFPDGQRLVLFESGTGASVEQLIVETNPFLRQRRP